MTRRTETRTAFRRTLMCAATAVAAALAVESPARAEGNVAEMSADGLVVRVDSRWTGGSSGGYWPIRLQITNTGESRELTFVFEPHRREAIPLVRRTVRSAGNSTHRVSLAVPLVGSGYRGDLKVLNESGREIPALRHGMLFQPMGDPGAVAPAVLVVGQAEVNAGGLLSAVAALNQQSSLPRRSMRMSPSFAGRANANIERVEASSLPTNWIDYSALDLVIVDLPTLETLESSQRGNALAQWTQAGGTLVVYGLGAAPQKSKKLESILQLASPRLPGDAWTAPTIAVRDQSVDAITNYLVSEFRGGSSPRGAPGGRPEFEVEQPRMQPEIDYRWRAGRGEAPFYVRSHLWGAVVGFAGDPFEGSPYDWAWLFATLEEPQYQWAMRHGISPRGETTGFVDFLIPGVKGVPVYSFLLLITAFTILIGPLNYFLMWKRKRLFLLVATIPCIAFATSLALFGYSAVSHGFEVKSRIRSVTLLDQRSQNSVSVSRVATFAGIPPSGGLNFSPESAVFPIWPAEKRFENGTVDWTESQQFESGFLQSRTRTQFLVVNHRRERGRLEIPPARGNRLSVSNGFAWNIEALLVLDDKGNPFFTKSLSPGETAELPPMSREDLQELKTLLRRAPLEPPDDVDPQRQGRGFFGMGRRHWPRGYERQFRFNYSSNMAEKKIAALLAADVDSRGRFTSAKSSLGPRTYLAVFSESPGIDVGVEQVTEVAGYHLLIGLY